MNWIVLEFQNEMDFQSSYNYLKINLFHELFEILPWGDVQYVSSIDI